MFPLRVRSNGAFAKRMQERAQKLVGQKFAARVRGNDATKFWLYQEFGTASYPIDPLEAKALVFPYAGGTAIRAHVDHPGIKPRRSVTKILHDAGEALLNRVDDAFLLDGAIDDPSNLRAAVVKAAEDAKQLIVDSLAQNVPGTRPVNIDFPKQSGKLLGKTAAEVFKEEAVVVDVSDHA